MDYANRAFLSVSDKTGLPELAESLDVLRYKLIASDGTAKAIKAAKVKVTDVEVITGFPEILSGRVKTIHPRTFGGILAARDLPSHRRDMAKHGIKPFQLVVVNFYDFAANPSIGQIDIGGPAMAMAAAKNHAFVGVLTNPNQYPGVIRELERDGELSSATRLLLADAATRYVSEYYGAVNAWFATLAK